MRRTTKTTTTIAFLCMLACCQSFVPRYGPRKGFSGTIAFSSPSSSSSSSSVLRHDDDLFTPTTATSRESSSTTIATSASLKECLQAENMERALDVLNRMPSPTTFDYNLVLTAYAQKGRVTEAEALVKHMVDRCKGQQSSNGNYNAHPDRNTYYQLLDALLKGGFKNSAERAEEILRAVVENFGSASTVAFNKVLKLWKQEAEYDNADVALERAERLLQSMMELGIADRISHTTVISILATKGDAVRANEMAEQMLLFSNPNLHPNTQTWNTVIYAWVRRGKLERAEKVLKRMEQLAGEAQDSSAKPDVVSFSTLLDGWAKTRRDDALPKMEHLFDRMKASGCQPSFWTYVTLIHTFARQLPDPQKAHDLLLDMYAEHKQHPELKPNTKLVTAVMDAWQKSGQGAEKAEALLNWMIEVGETDRHLAPNEYSFSCKCKYSIDEDGQTISGISTFTVTHNHLPLSQPPFPPGVRVAYRARRFEQGRF